MSFTYADEPRRDIFCIDVKSFFASAECADRGLDPLTTMLIVMSKASNAGGLVLAASPAAKKKLGISNVTRKYEVPSDPDLMIVPPRMNFYIKKNQELTDIFLEYVSREDLHAYSIDESFLDVTASHRLFGASNEHIARKIQRHVYQKEGLILTVGIGDNPLLAKLALDNDAKHNEQNHFVATWHYEDVPQTIWRIPHLTDMWGIGRKTALRLNRLGIYSPKELAHADYYQLKEALGVMGTQLYAAAWGIDRSRIAEKYTPKENGYGNSQILDRDYTRIQEVEVVIRELADHVASRMRASLCQCQCVHLFIGYSKTSGGGFARQMKIPATNQTKLLCEYCLTIFHKYYNGSAVRQIGLRCGKLVRHEYLQLDLFQDPAEQIEQQKLEVLIDRIRQRYGFKSLVHASSLTPGGTAIMRSSLTGGHQAETEDAP